MELSIKGRTALAKLSIESTLLRAKSLTKKGELVAARDHYTAVLAAFPNNKKAQRGLATLGGTQQPAIKKGPPKEIINELINHYNNGQLKLVVDHAQALTKQYPEAFEIWNILGASATQIGKLDQAINAFRRMLFIKPNSAEAYNNMGNALRLQGKLEEAILAYNNALSIRPHYAEAHSNLGISFTDQGKLERAIASCKDALAINPDFAEAYNNIGIAFGKQGKREEAMEAYKKSISIRPNYAEAYYNIGNTLKGITFKKKSTSLQKIMISLLDKKSYVRPSDIANAAISLLKFEPRLQQYFRTPSVHELRRSPEDLIKDLSEIPLLIKLMSICPLPDQELEKIFTELRATLLSSISSIKASPAVVKVQSALALQCFTNEYIYNQNEHEKNELLILERRVQESIDKKEQPSPESVLCLASYKALNNYEWASSLNINSDIQEVFTRQIIEPNHEASFKSNLPVLGTITDKISSEVQNQYEANPYPRWVNLELRSAPASIAKLVDEAQIKLSSPTIKKVNAPNILVAGCGTGQHSIGTAARFKNSKVLAIDLSLSSLAYAKRKTEELGIKNIEYMQADILDLDKLDRKFDIIESSGVLHHMNNPRAGWKILTDCLRVGGIIKIGLYSKLARQHIVEIREEIIGLGIGSSDDEMASFRAMVMHSTKNHHQRILSSADFYSLSNLRDLLFHVQEHRFTIPQIKDCLIDLGLTFCGFEADKIVSHFKSTNTGESDLYNLDKWQAYEESNPRVFAGMYQFWSQKLV